MKVNIFGTDVTIKEKFCSLNGCKPSTVETPYINVYVRLTNHCNAQCAFCEFRNNKCEKHFDIYKMYYALSEVSKVIKINKVSFTGGETTLDMINLNYALSLVKKIDKNIFTVVHTNGTKLHELDKNENINNISLSRHHYDNVINNQIFDFKNWNEIQVSQRISEFKDKKKLHFSCNLIKGYIDSQSDMVKYLEAAALMEVHDVGFVSLMRINDFCKKYFMNFSDIKLDNNVISKVRDWNMSEVCKCANYLYITSNNDVVKVYSRYYIDPDNKCGNLVYDINCLRDGFNGTVLFR